MDAARCMGEANLVKGDLLEILASWPETAAEDKFKSKVALACMELLVPLTWPIEKDNTQMTVNHHRHIPYLQHAQRSYKRAILDHDSGVILKTCVRTALPSIALPLRERAPRDEGIIKLLLYFLRNVAMVSNPRKPHHGDTDGVSSRSRTIEAFREQEVLALLLTLASNIGDDFSNQDTVLMEVLFHLLKGINVDRLFMDKKELSDNSGKELKSLLSKEANMHRSYNRNAPTRHNRFGTMIWIKRDDAGRHSTVSGQEVLKDGVQALSKMDSTKKWSRPKRHTQADQAATERFDIEESLTESARTHLRSFVEEFLDSSFNPLFHHIRRAIEREADRVLEIHKPQYFYLISWFLEAERVRHRKQREVRKLNKDKKLEETFETDSFAWVASVLTQESFVLLNRYIQDRLDLKEWRDLQAGMLCFTQTLLIVQDMAQSPAEDDQEISENIQNRIFYEETTHDRVIAILRGYKDQGFSYLDACTELSHVFLRMLEQYSREHIDLQIRSKRRAKKKFASKPTEQGLTTEADQEEESEQEEDIREAERTSRERQFDFKRFSTKFTTQACIDTFVQFLKYYQDLTTEQLKRAHRFFYRVAFKQELSVMLFRLDIITLFNRMIKGPNDLDSKNPMFKDWEELVRQVLKRLFKKLDQRPQLFIELLFSKINSTTFFLENGFEKQTMSKSRPPAALQIRGNYDLHQQIGILMLIYKDDDPNGIVPWLVKLLGTAFSERLSWENENAARRASEQQEAGGSGSNDIAIVSKAPSITVVPPSEPIRIAMFKDAKLRLLLELCQLERLGIDDVVGATWIIPGSIPATLLQQNRDSILHFQSNPLVLDGDDAEDPEGLLRRKPLPKPRRAEYDDEDSDGSLGIASDADNEFLFPVGGPTNTVGKKQNALDLLRKKRRRQVRHDDGDDDGQLLTEAELAARRKARHDADLERRRKIKSTEFIHDSDDESDVDKDREFFAREESRRNGQRAKVMEALAAGRFTKPALSKAKSSARKRKGTRIDNGEDAEGFDGTVSKKNKWKASSDIEVLTDDDDDMDIDHDLPAAPVRNARLSSSNDSGASGDDDDNEVERRDQGQDEDGEDTPASSPPDNLFKGVTEVDSQQGAPSPPSSQAETRIKTAELSLGATEDDEGDIVPVTAASRRRPRAVFEDSDDE